MRQSFRRAAFAAFCSYVLSHNLGLAAVSGAAVRFRLYVIGASQPVASPISSLSAQQLIFWGRRPSSAASSSGSRITSDFEASAADSGADHGACGWLIVLLYIGVSFRLREIRLFNFSIEIPRPEIAVMRFFVSAADMTATALIAYVLLPSVAALASARFCQFTSPPTRLALLPPFRAGWACSMARCFMP